MHAYTHTRKCIQIIYIQTYMHTYIQDLEGTMESSRKEVTHTYKHTHTHTYIHIYIQDLEGTLGGSRKEVTDIYIHA